MEKIEFFLASPDERVRFSALEVILEQEDERVPSIAEPYLSDSTAENTRLRQAALDVFADKQWQLKDPETFKNAASPLGFFLNPKNCIQRSQ